MKKVVLTGVKVDTSLRYAFVCGLARGQYPVFVSATDSAGNTQTTAASTVLVVR